MQDVIALILGFVQLDLDMIHFIVDVVVKLFVEFVLYLLGQAEVVRVIVRRVKILGLSRDDAELLLVCVRTHVVEVTSKRHVHNWQAWETVYRRANVQVAKNIDIVGVHLVYLAQIVLRRTQIARNELRS